MILKKKDIYWLLIPLLVIANSTLILLKVGDMGITPDSRFYFYLAKRLPEVNNSTLPIFYPLILRLLNFLFNDYVVTSKIVCLISIIFIYGFTLVKNFYWKELWFVFAIPALVFCYSWSWSETVLLPLLLLFVYQNYSLLENENNKGYLLKNTAILFLMFLTKYSALFIVIGFVLFAGFTFFKNKKIGRLMIVSATIFGILATIYLFFNYIQTGYFFGLRGAPDFGKKNIRLSFFNIFYSLNPFIKSRLLVFYTLHYFYLFVVILVANLTIWWYIIKKNLLNSIGVLFLVCASTFLIFSIISYFKVSIDNLDSRLLLPFVFLYYVSLMFFLGKYLKKNLLFIIAVISMLINILELLLMTNASVI